MNTKTVLIVDDSELDRAFLAQALVKKGGFKTIGASSGAQCLDILSASAVDLVLMDIMMPETSGMQVLEQVRQKYNPIELPVIMVTARSDVSDVVSCLHSGANDYITKPVHFDVAISRIITHLKISDMSRRMSKLKEIAALTAMITTYNHEINNPLAIAIGCLEKTDWNGEENKARIQSALWRITDIVKRIAAVGEKHEVEYETYSGAHTMVKLT